MAITLQEKNALADLVVFRRWALTYPQVHECGWLNEESCRAYARIRWGGVTGQRGVTIRGRKLWTAANQALRVTSSTEIDGSLWKVEWNFREAMKTGEMPKLANRTHYYGHLLEDSIGLETLGYVIAPDATRAKMAAAVTLGPRAHSEHLSVSREGVADWEKVKAMNAELMVRYNKAIAHAKNTLAQKLWEIEQLECQVAFLSTGATFESVQMPDVA
jgi:hypothetical protein